MTNWGAGFLLRYIICPIGVFSFFFSLFGGNGNELDTLGIIMFPLVSVYTWFGPKMFGDE